jgi:ATP-dependent helicase/nuclease subunit B
VTIRTQLVRPADALAALGDSVAAAKGGVPLAPVTVIVPTNAAGVMARRSLGRGNGIAAVNMVTPYRLAELVAAPALHDQGRNPVSTPIVDITIRSVLADEPRSFAEVAGHPSTITALRDLHRELRQAGPAALQALATSSDRGREAARVSVATTARLSAEWYDEGDLMLGTIERLGAAPLPGLERVIVFLPHPTAGLELELLRAIGSVGELQLLATHTGVPSVDAEMDAFAERLAGTTTAPAPTPRRCDGPVVISTTDADDEVRHAIRVVLDHARAGTPFARMAILWPSDRPYARLVEHHLEAAQLPWNGRPGTLVTERLVPRFLLDLLDVDRRGLRRSDLFDLLADVPTRGDDGQIVQVAKWERIARKAGVNRDEHWQPRLSRFAAAERARAERSDDPRPWAVRDAEMADELAAFVRELRRDLGHPKATRPWSDWADWCEHQISWRLGNRVLGTLSESERLAHDHTARVLDRLRHLDALGPPARRSQFRAVFAAEFEIAPGKLGRIGTGVTIGSLTGAVGLDSDVVIVLGAADGQLPPGPTTDPLITDHDRRSAGLPTSAARSVRAHRNFMAVVETARHLVVCVPRGDLRSTSERLESRWLAAHLPDADVRTVSSHHAGLIAAEFPAAQNEHRLRERVVVAADGPAELLARCADDPIAIRALTMRSARRQARLTEFDGDLSTRQIDHFARPVSPSQLEAWAKCPHGYFVQYLLGVRRVDDSTEDLALSPIERGNVVHDTLDRFNHEVLAGSLPQPGPHGWSSVHTERLLALYDEVADEFERTGRTGRAAHWRLDRRSVGVELLNWFARDGLQVAATGAQIVSSELRFGSDGTITLPLPDGHRLSVRGSVDRIDRRSTGELVVMDHKTGRDNDFKQIDAADPTEGCTKFQLPTYAAAALAIFGDAATPPSVHAEYDFFERGGYRRHGYSFDETVWEHVAADLGKLVAGIETGLFPATPEIPKWEFRINCHYCQPDGLGVAERFGEWQLKQVDPRFAAWVPNHDGDNSDERQPCPT